MFMLFLISIAPFLAVVSWDFFRSDRNFFAVLFLFFDLSRSLIAFCISGSVGLVFRICFADCFVGDNKNALIPALATFSAPWIFIDLMSSRILLKRFAGVLFFMWLLVDVSIKVCRILYKRLSSFVCGVLWMRY